MCRQLSQRERTNYASSELVAPERSTYAPSELVAPERTTYAPFELVTPERTTSAPSELVAPERIRSAPRDDDSSDEDVIVVNRTTQRLHLAMITRFRQHHHVLS
jgi:hypothetical protein